MRLQLKHVAFCLILLIPAAIFLGLAGPASQPSPLHQDLINLRNALVSVELQLKRAQSDDASTPAKQEKPATTTTTSSSTSTDNTRQGVVLRNRFRELLRRRAAEKHTEVQGVIPPDTPLVPAGESVTIKLRPEDDSPAAGAAAAKAQSVRISANDIPEGLSGVLSIASAVSFCNCPSLEYGGRATLIQQRAKNHAFIHSRPLMEDLGDTEGIRTITEKVRQDCDGKGACDFKVGLSSLSPVAGCPGKIAVDFTCKPQPGSLGNSSKLRAISDILARNILFTAHLIEPAVGRVLPLSCESPALAGYLQKYVRRMGSPWGKFLVYRGGHDVKYHIEVTDVSKPPLKNRYHDPSRNLHVDWVRPVTYRAEGDTFNVWPVQFSLPSYRYLSSVKWKRSGQEAFAPSIPGNKNTYKHSAKAGQQGDAEPDEEYFREYRHSYYCVTRKKKGWDCLRHYEILSQGCVPYFVDLHKLPASTMPFFPKKLVMEAMSLPGVTFKDDFKGSFLNLSSYSIDFNVFDKEKYYKLAAQIQNHARKYLTSEAMASYVLRALAQEGGPKNPRKVLFIHHCYHDYMGDSLWTGFKELESKGLLDLVADIVPPRELSTGGADSKSGRLYNLEKCEHGRKTALQSSAVTLEKRDFYKGNPYGGWGSHRSHNEFPHDTAVSLENIEDRIRRKEFDVVVYGTAMRTDAWNELVLQHYNRNQIALINGADGVEMIPHYGKMSKTGVLFTRENYDEPGGYINMATCADAPGVAECNGFDCCSWIYGGSRVVWTSATANSTDWLTCGKENDFCNCTGEMRFGDPRRNVWSQISLQTETKVRCKNINAEGPFTDPSVGQPKVCQCLARNGHNEHLKVKK
eukprot:TRINITY_DN18265_c5_g1_i1.p1 TRINITY_DN18265_c5_g1~~TRINITY_DN18265_c5_g1_i1.p1  ORF type:complete len:856 (+),score=237.74 TRINITY_DN18265_c5_g1_i1:73-2640(+)